MLDLIQKFDNYILLYIKDNMHSPIMDRVMVAVTSLGNGGIIWLIIASILILNKKYRNVGIAAIAALILGTILGEGIMKHLFHRMRPSAELPVSELLIPKPLSYSFPSGHATSAFAVAGVLAKYLKKYAVGIFVLAALIAFSRLYLYVHYPSDVIVGMLLGLLYSKIVINMFIKSKWRIYDSSNQER